MASEAEIVLTLKEAPHVHASSEAALYLARNHTTALNAALLPCACYQPEGHLVAIVDITVNLGAAAEQSAGLAKRSS